MLRQALWIGLGGFAGANARWLVGAWVTTRFGARMPYGTLVVNVTGCLLLGFLAGVIEARAAHPGLRPALAIGFLGAYTTFSTFGYETMLLIEEGNLLRASVYVLASVLFGLVGVWLGMLAGRALA